MPRPRLYASDADKQAAYRARKAQDGKALTVILPADVAAAFDAYMLREASNGRQRDRSQVIVDLVSAQLLRKR